MVKELLNRRYKKLSASAKVESAVSSAFYSGSYPFAHGGIGRVAGALCFYLDKCHAFFDGKKERVHFYQDKACKLLIFRLKKFPDRARDDAIGPITG